MRLIGSKYCQESYILKLLFDLLYEKYMIICIYGFDKLPLNETESEKKVKALQGRCSYSMRIHIK